MKTAAGQETQHQTRAGRRLFVLDTNVLIHDPGALFRFQEHDVYLPMMVLEELDSAKKGITEVARNVRQVSRMLDDLVGGADRLAIERGLPLPGLPAGSGNPGETNGHGRLLFQTRALPNGVPGTLPGKIQDNSILATAVALQNDDPHRKVTLVSKDINLRIKAHLMGIHAEDYFNDKVLDDVRLLYSGVVEVPSHSWERAAPLEKADPAQADTLFAIDGLTVAYPNQCLYTCGENPIELLVRKPAPGGAPEAAVVEVAQDYRSANNAVWGIQARNREQNFAFNLLMDSQVDFVSLLGQAGTGKTLLALAAGLAQTLEQNRYREIVMTRVTVPVGEDIGFLPGTEEEKMTPWMGALVDNLEVLTQSEGEQTWNRAATNDFLHSRIKIRSLNFMRGCTFLNRYIIIDEAQNLTPKQIKTLVTRAGPGTKIVCLGNVAQIDTPYLSETTSGLTYAVDHFKHWEHSGHVTLLRGERSRLADYAAETL